MGTELTPIPRQPAPDIVEKRLRPGGEFVALGFGNAVLANLVEQRFVADLQQNGGLLAVPVDGWPTFAVFCKGGRQEFDRHIFPVRVMPASLSFAHRNKFATILASDTESDNPSCGGRALRDAWLPTFAKDRKGGPPAGAKALGVLSTAKLPFDLAVGLFSALVCGVGR